MEAPLGSPHNKHLLGVTAKNTICDSQIQQKDTWKDLWNGVNQTQANFNL